MELHDIWSLPGWRVRVSRLFPNLSNQTSLRPFLGATVGILVLAFASGSAAAQNTDSDVVLHKLFLETLHRPPTRRERESYLPLLSNHDGTQVIGLAQKLMALTEFREPMKALPAISKIEYLYARLVDRAPDPEGQSFWLKRLQTVSMDTLIAEMIHSTEYYNLIYKKLGINPDVQFMRSAIKAEAQRRQRNLTEAAETWRDALLLSDCQGVNPWSLIALRNLSEIYLNNFDYGYAQLFATRYVADLESIDPAYPELAHALLIRGRIHAAKQEFSNAVVCMERGLKIVRATPVDREDTFLVGYLAANCAAIGDLSRSKKYEQMLWDSVNQEKDIDQRVTVLFGQARKLKDACLDSFPDTVKRAYLTIARHCYERALSITPLQTSVDLGNLNGIYRDLIPIDLRLGQNDQALADCRNWMKLCLEHRKSTNAHRCECLIRFTQTLTDLHRTCTTDEKTNCVSYLVLAQKYGENVHGTTGLEYCFNIADIYAKVGVFDQAVFSVHEGMSRARKDCEIDKETLQLFSVRASKTLKQYEKQRRAWHGGSCTNEIITGRRNSSNRN